MEKYIHFLETVRQWNEQGQETVPLVEIVELLIPCILHLENQVGEKNISTIVKKGLDLYNLGPKEVFIKNLNQTFQTKASGTETSPSQWRKRCFCENGSLSLDPIQLRNNNVRACINAINTIIEASILNEHGAMASNLLLAVSKYTDALKLLTKHSKLHDEEIETFQSLIDDFFELWIRIFGSHGVTNYLHMLGAGHVHYFLKNIGACTFTRNKDGRH
jgi:hypothetical protein